MRRTNLPAGVEVFDPPNEDGYYAFRHLPDGRVLTVMALTFGRARLTIGRDLYSYDCGW